MNISPIKIVNYLAPNGKEPITEWILELDPITRAVVRARISRVRLGNFGECKRIKNGEGIWEIIIDYGPGYRIYFGKETCM